MNITATPEIDISVTRMPARAELSEVVRLRAASFYSAADDSRYASGGVHACFDEDELERIQQSDSTSHYLFARNLKGNLIGYSRISWIEASDPHFDDRFHKVFAGAISHAMHLRTTIIEKDYRSVGGGCRERWAPLSFSVRSSQVSRPLEQLPNYVL